MARIKKNAQYTPTPENVAATIAGFTCYSEYQKKRDSGLITEEERDTFNKYNNVLQPATFANRGIVRKARVAATKRKAQDMIDFSEITMNAIKRVRELESVIADLKKRLENV